jgi:SpoVK/Ycf46/Vps4 family AAA+-type ATPase
VRPANRSLPEILAPRAAVRQLLESLASTGGPARVVARGRLGSGRRTLLAAVAAAANRRLGMVDFQLLAASSRIDQLRSLLRECHLSGMLPCIDGLPGARALEDVERDRLAELLRSHPGPLAFRMPLETSPPLDPGYLAIDLPPLGDAARLRLWRRAIETHRLAVNDVEALAARFRVGPGVVEHVVNEVARTAPGDRGERDQTGAVVAALRQHVEVRLSSVAERIPRLPTWSSVILSEEVADRLRELVARARHRRIVFDEWGYDRQASSGRGLTALFQGPPGTGKTLAAGLLARELGLELYRIDLSRIVSKWIGETEQNLATAFDAAEDGQAVILFDEADSLFARRTEVKTSVDRYANLEVNYLLSRLDSFGGIAILTTNLSGSIDRAFKRRLSMRLHFPFPDEEMRAKLWRVHLPPEAPIGDELDFSDLASRYRVSGGYIRNAALRAAFLAAADGSALTIEHFERAIRLEYIEVGKLTDAGVLE